jgi:Ca2+-transporting ATPase
MVGDGKWRPCIESGQYRSYGKKGNWNCKEAADLILIDDDLSKMIIAVAAGRHI